METQSDKKTVIAVIQARMNSSRFPAKVLSNLAGRPMVAHVIERAGMIVGVDQVVLAIPEQNYAIMKHLCPEIEKGSEADVLHRFWKAALARKADVIIRLTGDCPLVCPSLIGSMLTWFMGQLEDLEPNAPLYLPLCQPFHQICDGFDSEIFNWAALDLAERHAAPDQREHVTTWMRQNVKMPVDASGELAHTWRNLMGPKLSVDTTDDLHFVAQVLDLASRTAEIPKAYQILRAAKIIEMENAAEAEAKAAANVSE